ncbi:ankyrin repeat domain-containing protein [Candidatus Symbiobacter mobilis]|nr:ankyrin repeat domain-containing protein [Candidatus Symbiobacter mobilis]
MLLAGVVLMAGWGAYGAEKQPSQSCDLHGLMDRRDYAAATACATSGANPNERDAGGRGPLNRLIWFGRDLSVIDQAEHPLIEALIDAGADLNVRPPQQEASAFEALLEFGDRTTARSLVRRMLLRPVHPADPNVSVSMQHTPPQGHRRLTPLLWAIKVGDAEMVTFLLKKGADPDFIPVRGMGTPMHHAVFYNRPEILRLLYQHGANILTVSPAPILEMVNNGVMTDLETLRTLLELGALNVLENQEAWLRRALSLRIGNQKPLTQAQFELLAPYLQIDFGQPQSLFLEQLLDNTARAQRATGANLPAFRAAFLHALNHNANPNGSCTLTRANATLLEMLVVIGRGDLALEKALIDHGANPNLADKDGDTPLHQIAYDRIDLQAMQATRCPDPKDARFLSIDTTKERASQPQRDDAIKTQATCEAIQQRLNRLDELEQLLLANGANPALKNAKGLTPGDCMREKRP